MPWSIGRRYTREQIREWFPALGPRDAVHRANWFANRNLMMEVRSSNREHNAALKRFRKTAGICSREAGQRAEKVAEWTSWRFAWARPATPNQKGG